MVLQHLRSGVAGLLAGQYATTVGCATADGALQALQR